MSAASTATAANTTTHLGPAPLPTIVATGLLLGLVHVLTEPNDLSALIVLSAGSSWRSCQLGLRWGAGHSTGLIVVTWLFLVVNKKFRVIRFGNYCDFGVALLMIAFGCWSLHYYWHFRPGRKGTDSGASLAVPDEETGVDQLPTTYHSLSGDIPHSHTVSAQDLLARDGDETLPLLASEPAERETMCCGMLYRPQVDIKNANTQRVTAFAYGIAHGLAGTGGILGVLPAVILNDWIKSWAYLLSFCIASIFVMSVFAATYGEMKGRVVRMSNKLLFQVGTFSSCVSLLVGILWIVLLSTGTLDDVFG